MKRVLGTVLVGGFLFVACGDDGEAGGGSTGGNAGQGKAGGGQAGAGNAGKGNMGGGGTASGGGKQAGGGVPSLAGESTGGTAPEIGGDSSVGGMSLGGASETMGGRSEGGTGGTGEPGSAGGGQAGDGAAGESGGGSPASVCSLLGDDSLPPVLISEIRWRGVGSGNDDFIELYNPTEATITLDTAWTIEVRSDVSGSYTVRWTGNGKSLGVNHHFLIVGTASTLTGDASLSSSITDSASVVLKRNGAVVDAVCYECGTPGKFDGSYTCQGAAVGVGTCAEAVDRSIERKPGDAAGNCLDTDDGATDWVNIAPSAPQNLAEPVTPAL